METNDRVETLSLELLRDLAARPAVPFHEGPVAACIQRYLQGLSLPIERDRYGNLIAFRSGGEDKGEQRPPIAFVAHMDHPGFEAVESSGEVVNARALGGVPQACFSEEVRFQILLPGDERLGAESAGPHGIEGDRMVSLRLDETRSLQFPRPVIYDLTDFHFDGELVHMRAADDLAGCACILAALRLLALEEDVGDVYGIFTRAEEVGLIGARLLASEGRLPANTLVVSLEASPTLPGAAIGEGPVIRVGDASFTFDAEAESVLAKAREELTEQRPDFKAQRLLMSGGTCEASAFRYYGYRTTGVAFPLGNYHNATPEGGIGTEYIHIDDFLGGIELIVQAAKGVPRRLESVPWRRMGDMPQDYSARLSQTAPTLFPDT